MIVFSRIPEADRLALDVLLRCASGKPRGTMMKQRLAIVAGAIAFACALTSSAFALTINDPGVVGILEGQVQGAGGSDPSTELVIANQLLLMAAGTTTLATTPPGVDCSNS